MIKRTALLILFLFASIFPAQAYNDADVIDGFKKTVFGSEYSSLFSSGAYIRKFNGTVRLHVTSYSETRKRQAEKFALSLNGLITGLKVGLVRNPAYANFRVHIARRRNYETTVRRVIYGNRNATVRGKCIVRSKFTRRGISKSDAVIVGDGSNKLFNRCMTEEILQGLGPLNDDPSLVHSMFNDRSRYTSFRRFDRLILNMLYDRRLQNGMSERQVSPLLGRVLRDVRRRIENR